SALLCFEILLIDDPDLSPTGHEPECESREREPGRGVEPLVSEVAEEEADERRDDEQGWDRQQRRRAPHTRRIPLLIVRALVLRRCHAGRPQRPNPLEKLFTNLGPTVLFSTADEGGGTLVEGAGRVKAERWFSPSTPPPGGPERPPSPTPGCRPSSAGGWEQRTLWCRA